MVALDDGVKLVSGSVRLATTTPLPEDAVFLGVARSQLSNASNVSIDETSVLEQPGILRFISGRDFADAFGKTLSHNGEPLLAMDDVSYQGQPVGLVVANDQHAALSARRFVSAIGDQRDHVTNIDEVLQQPFDAQKRNNELITGHWKVRRGDIAAAFRSADEVLRSTYYSEPASQVPLEPHCVVVQEVDGQILVRSSTQAPYWAKRDICKLFDLETHQVEVEVPRMGGAFGAKLETKVELLAVAAHLLLRRSTDRPVVLLYDREDVFYTVQKHEARVAIESAIKGGMIVGRRIELVYNGGAFPKPTPARSGMLRALGPYRIDNLHIDSFMCRSNTVPAGAMRGSMTTQVAFAYESEMDKIAAHLGISPFEIRERHLMRSGDTYLTGAPISDLHFDRILGSLKETVDAWKEEPVELRPWERRGTGIGLMIKSTATPSVSEAELTFYSSGHCELRAASVEFGQGIVETLVQIVAETLRISKDRIDYAQASTGLGLFDSLTASSRSAASMGTAVLRAAQDLREKFARLDSVPDDLIDELNGDSAVDGSRIANELGMSLRNEGLDELKGMGVYSSTGGADLLDPDTSQGPNPSVHWHQGGAAVELIVDVGTGKVRMARGFGVSYAGRVLNSGAVTGQNEGSFIYGLGQSLFERLEYADGHLTNASLAEYLVPGFADIPGRLHTDALESSGTSVEPHGVGEMVVPAVGPAIANAITEAIGARPHSLPCTSENVLNLIRGEYHE